MFNYAKWELVTIPLFFGFAITFFVTRLVFFPFWYVQLSSTFTVYITSHVHLITVRRYMCTVGTHLQIAQHFKQYYVIETFV